MVRWIALFACLTFIVGCGEDTPVTGRTETALGPSFLVPDGREMEISGQRIDLNNPLPLRSSDYVRLYVNEDPPADMFEHEPVYERGETPAPYTIVDGDGGSGGAAAILRTQKTIGLETVTLIALIQWEMTRPEFADAWAVWESLASEQSK